MAAASRARHTGPADIDPPVGDHIRVIHLLHCCASSYQPKAPGPAVQGHAAASCHNNSCQLPETCQAQTYQAGRIVPATLLLPNTHSHNSQEGAATRQDTGQRIKLLAGHGLSDSGCLPARFAIWYASRCWTICRIRRGRPWWHGRCPWATQLPLHAPDGRNGALFGTQGTRSHMAHQDSMSAVQKDFELPIQVIHPTSPSESTSLSE